MTRNQAIAAKCRECIHDPQAAGTWREQVAVCGCTDCPLWRFRPLPRHAPPWLSSRSVGDLPDGFAGLSHDAAIAALRAVAKVANEAAQGLDDTCHRGSDA